MDAGRPTPFFEALLARHPEWRAIPLRPPKTDPRSGVSLIVPAPLGSDLSQSLYIEDDLGEITIGFDEGHGHLEWPFESRGASEQDWRDPLWLVDAILAEKIVVSSGWIDDQLRVASLHEVAVTPSLLVPNLQRLRVRSWRGTYNEDTWLNAVRHEDG